MIILSSLVFALSLNSFLFLSPAWNKLQTSVKNYSTEKTNKEVTSDLYLVKLWTWSSIIELKAWTDMKKVSELRFSLLWDPIASKINDIFTENKNFEVIKSSNVPWIYSVVVKTLKVQDINKGDSIIKIVYTKSWTAVTSFNLAETQFISEKDTYELQSSSVEF